MTRSRAYLARRTAVRLIVWGTLTIGAWLMLTTLAGSALDAALGLD